MWLSVQMPPKPKKAKTGEPSGSDVAEHTPSSVAHSASPSSALLLGLNGEFPSALASPKIIRVAVGTQGPSKVQ